MSKKLVIAAVLTAAIIGGASLAVIAGREPGGEIGTPHPAPEMGAVTIDKRMAKVLKLTESQQGQIKAIRDAETEKFKPLLEKMRENDKLLMQAAEATKLDEVAVKSIATAQGGIKAELIFSRVRASSRINALLTPEQRELLKLLRPEIDQRHSPPPFAGKGE